MKVTKYAVGAFLNQSSLCEAKHIHLLSFIYELWQQLACLLDLITLALLIARNFYKPENDDVFIKKVKNDVKNFLTKESRKRVLLFPPLPSYYRFLIHNLIQQCDPAMNLCSISVGANEQRRTVVYFAQNLEINDSNMFKGSNKSTGSTISSYTTTTTTTTTTTATTGTTQNQNEIAWNPLPTDSEKSSMSPAVQKRRNRRPDMQLYVPKAKRQSDNKEKEMAAAVTSDPQQKEVVKLKNETCRQANTAKGKLKLRHEMGTLVPPSRTTEMKEVMPKTNSVFVRTSNMHETDKIATQPVKTLSINQQHAYHSKPLTNEKRKNIVKKKLCGDSSVAPVVSKVTEFPSPVLSSELCQVNQNESFLNCEPSSLPLSGNSTTEFSTDSRITEAYLTEHKSCSAADNVHLELGDKQVLPKENFNEEIQQCSVLNANNSISLLSECCSADGLQVSNCYQENENCISVCNNANLKHDLSNSGESLHMGTSVDDHLVAIKHSIDEEIIKGNSDNHQVQVTDIIKVSTEVSCSNNDLHMDDKITNADSGPQHSARLMSRKQSNEDHGSWDAIYDDSGECLDKSLIDQITAIVGDVKIDTPQIDYLAFQTVEPQLSDEDFGHILEIYDFPVEFKSEDLISAFSSFKERGFNIKWVNDTHALAVFSSRASAEEALLIQHPIIKTRPLSQGIKESKLKARRCAEFLQPYKARPETSAYLARRLVAGALGLQLNVSPNQRADDQRKLSEAKERKLLATKQREDVWEGLPGSYD